jgi:hypothetical protein
MQATENAMAEALSVLFKIGRLQDMKKPAPSVIERALSAFLHETLDAAARRTELGIPANTAVRYEVQWFDDVLEASDRLPLHLSVRGPRHLTEPLHDKLKAGLVDGGWVSSSSDYTKLADTLGIPRQHRVDFKLYVRSPTGEKFGT